MAELVHPEARRHFPEQHDGKLWVWRRPSNGAHFRTCSWCGSINPEDLAAEPSWTPEWADQKHGWPHKFYVNIPNREADKLVVVGSTGGGNPNRKLDEGWVRWEDLTPEQVEVAERDGYAKYQGEPPIGLLFGTRPDHFGKFYTTHLADPSLEPSIKTAIERGSGIQFEFKNDRVTWSAAPKEA